MSGRGWHLLWAAALVIEALLLVAGVVILLLGNLAGAWLVVLALANFPTAMLWWRRTRDKEPDVG